MGVILRVPALFLLEAWFRTSPLKAIQVNTIDVEIIVTVVYYLCRFLKDIPESADLNFHIKQSAVETLNFLNKHVDTM